jgi:peptide/nickel transport system permease protein
VLAPALLICEFDLFTQTITYSEGVVMDPAFENSVKRAVMDRLGEFVYEGKTYTIESAGGKKYAVRHYSDSAMQYISGPVGEGFEAAVEAAVAAGEGNFEFGGNRYLIDKTTSGACDIYSFTLGEMLYVSSTYVLDIFRGASMPNDFLKTALIGYCRGGAFNYDGIDYVISEEVEDGDTVVNIYRSGETNPYAQFTTFSVSRRSGSGDLTIEFKEDVRRKIEEMAEQGKIVDTLVTKVEKQASDGSIIVDEDGNVVYEDTEVTITRKGDNYAITCDRIRYQIDIYAPPFSEISTDLHILGTDGDGFDIFARIMYGGRVSLIVGFVVVIIETLLGIIMGGISGYFGGWVDTLVMRLVEIFYCIPSLPIMIIIGAYLDDDQVNPYVRLIWLMAVLGFLGWASVARLVRGQILSLREQEFMLATEVGGLRVSRRIFRHLIPNVMPQLIVAATSELGSVILLESTLSFLGLGVKHPLATWGTMINSVSDYNKIVNYTYIWIPVGLLICLTVIAFNFVGDGLRDAFDPKMKT